MATKTTKLDPRALQRVSGPTWAPLKDAVLAIADSLLSVPHRTKNLLTTIYVKFERADGSVYAVMWVKSAAKGVVVGLSMPAGTDSARLHDAPSGMKYPGLTKYLTVREGDAIPEELAAWALAAHDNS